MVFEGVLNKMHTQLDQQVQYYLTLDNALVHMNNLLEKEISIQHTGYQCLNCNKTKKIYRQGFCYDCFVSSPAVGEWIMRPELSKAHLGIEDRDLAYEKKVQLQPHVVYFAIASDLKVGVTRKTQIPTRWIDQGASKAYAIVEVPNRYLAGITEIALKNFYTDKTNWRKMLQNINMEVNSEIALSEVRNYLPNEIIPYFDQTNHEELSIVYPVIEYPTKVNSLNLEKSPFFTGKLTGIRGQYLLFDDGTVFNIRSYEGFKVIINII